VLLPPVLLPPVPVALLPPRPPDPAVEVFVSLPHAKDERPMRKANAGKRS